MRSRGLRWWQCESASEIIPTLIRSAETLRPEPNRAWLDAGFNPPLAESARIQALFGRNARHPRLPRGETIEVSQNHALIALVEYY